MINVKAGARTRVSTFLAGFFLLILCLLLRPIVSEIPMAALVAVMFVVSYSTFDWRSIAPDHLRRMPRSETAVMLLTVVLTVITGNLSIGVIAGVILAALLFSRRVQHLTTVTCLDAVPAQAAHLTSVIDPDRTTAIYAVSGELFFASASDLADHFDYAGDPGHVVIDLSAAHVWDASAIAVLDRVVERYRHRGITAELVGLNEPSGHLVERLSDRLTASH